MPCGKASTLEKALLVSAAVATPTTFLLTENKTNLLTSLEVGLVVGALAGGLYALSTCGFSITNCLGGGVVGIVSDAGCTLFGGMFGG